MNKEEYLQLTLEDIINSYPRPQILSSLGNKKLGPITHFDGLSLITCKGKTDICKSVCYDAFSVKTFLGGKKNLVKAAWYSYLAENNPDELKEQLSWEVEHLATDRVRLHVGGDFVNSEHINLWTDIIMKNKNKLFWSYTHCWHIKEMYKALLELKSLDNMVLFASVDSITGLPPEKDQWRIAQLTEVYKLNNSILCPESIKKIKDISCNSCKLCFQKAIRTNIIFPLHGIGRKVNTDYVLR